MSSATAGFGGSQRNVGQAALFAAGLLLWLLNHPYQGIWHDARIYGLLAAHWLHPAALANDLFFRFGSQGELSLFTPLFGGLSGWLGLDRASWWVVLSGGAAWIAAVQALSLRMLGPGMAAGVAVLLAAVLTVSYSPNAGTFVLTENFATARSWALPIGIAGVAVAAAGRLVTGLALAALSLLLHPLLGIWPLAICILVGLRLRACAALIGSSVAASIAIGLANLDLPYLRLMSGDWLAFAREIAPDVVFRTGRMRLVEFGAVLVCLLLGARWGSERCQPLFRRALLLGLGGLAIALIASLWLPVELLVQGQAWRVLWLLLPLAMIALLDLAQQIGRKSRVGPALLMLAAAVASLSAAKALTAIYLLGLSAIVPARWWLHLDAVLARWRSPLNAGVGLLWLLLLPGIFASWDLAGSQMLRPWWSGPDWIHGVLAGGVWHIALLPVGLAAWRSHPWPLAAQAGAGLVLAALTLVVLTQWDHRTESRRSEESCFLAPRCPPHPFRQLIDIGATVSWPARETTVWFVLNRASYYGEIQRTGAVFSLAKFEEWTRRDRHMATGPEPADLCRDPLLDWLVVGVPAQGVAPKAEAGGEFLYSCADFRAVPQAPTFAAPQQ